MRLTRNHALLFMLLCLMVTAVLRIPHLQDTPPGVHYDEAANAILAAEIGRGDSLPIFIESYTGKEVLFFYLAGGLMHLLGDSVFTLRLTAVFIGILTVATTYWLGVELFRDRRVAILAAVLLAISFWHIVFSHLGFRAITQPLLQALTLAALLHGLRRNQWRWFIFAGICLGLTGYTYLAARLFPVLLLIGLLPVLLARQKWKLRWRQLLLTGGMALIVLAPLLVYFVTHPDRFWVRITQVSPAGPAGLPLSESVVRSLQMFFLVGDPYVRFNVPQRPLFDLLTGAFMVVGWLAVLWHWRRLQGDWQRSGHLILLLAPFIMLLPTALAVNEIVPSNLRAIGLIPFVFYLPAYGLFVLLQDLWRRYQRPKPTEAVLFLGTLLLLFGGLYAYQLYYQQWGPRTDLFLETDGDLTAVAPILDQLNLENSTLYVSALHYQHPTLALLSEQYGSIKWLPNSEAIVFPAQGTAVYVYPHKSQPQDWTVPYLEQSQIIASGEMPDGESSFTVYQLNEMPTIQPTHPVTATFDNDITLLGYDVLADGQSGGTIPLLLYWQAHLPQTEDFTPFVHLEDAWGNRWSQTETFAYPGRQWMRDEIIVQKVEVTVPDGAPPGAYGLRVGVFSGSSGAQLLRVDENGRFAGTTYVIEDVPVHVSPPPENVPQPAHVLNRQIRDDLTLLGYERGAQELATGEPLAFNFWWLANAIQTRLTTRLELQSLERVGGYGFATQTPVHNTYPFESWQAPIFLIDRQSERIPENVLPGDYRVNLRIIGGNDETIDLIDLGELTVKASERVFTQPESDVQTEATFGGEIQLVGYDLVETETPNQFTLNLVWQALEQPSADYTVFVHLLQADGTCNPCVWQQDVMPQQNQYPTSRWLPGEFVVDSYTIVLPEDTAVNDYPLEIGLYLAETGQRLQVTEQGEPDGDVVFLRPLSVR